LCFFIELKEQIVKEKYNEEQIIDHETERRRYRRKRRVRNQIISYIAAVILMAGIVAGADFGIQKLVTVIKDMQEANVKPEGSVVEASGTGEEPPIVIPVPEQDDDEQIIENEPEEISALDVIVEKCLAELTVEDKVAGLFIITPEELTGVGQVIRAGDTTKDKLREFAVGGLVYFKKNIQSATQLTEMLSSTRNMSKYPIFLAVDEEGGLVTRVAGGNLAENVGPMGDIGATGDPENAKNAGRSIGSYLKEFGFDLNFAPVADVLTGEGNETIGSRSFGTDPAAVAEMIAAYVGGMKEAGVYSTLKHFPGLGSTTVDTHVGMSVISSNLDDMRNSEFLPFIAGIEAGAEFIMMGHVSVPDVIGDNTPASLSKKMINEILRGELGYDGIVTTDALNMGAITEYYTAAEASIKALEAGADMLLMPENFAEAYAGVLEAVQNGTISEERLNESLRRIYRVKYAGQVEE
jgi:beta-N-acetylhexosaminidase